jgi:hypothetical protein
MVQSQWFRSTVFLFMGFLALGLSGCQSGAAGGSPTVGTAPTVQVAVVERRDVSITSEWIATMDGR